MTVRIARDMPDSKNTDLSDIVAPNSNIKGAADMIRFAEKNKAQELVILSGILLNLLLPIGSSLGVKNLLFLAIFLLATIALILSLLTAVLHYLTSLRQLPIRFALPIAVTLALTVTTSVLMGTLPITARDALIHHLAVPKWWLEADTVFISSWHPWSRYPMNLQLAYCGLLELGLERLTPYYHLLYQLILCYITLRITEKLTGDRLLSHLSVLLCLTLPTLFKLSTIPLVDLPLALYCVIAIEQLLEGKESSRKGHLVTAGLALGLALSTKPNGLLFFAALTTSYLLCLTRAGEVRYAIRSMLTLSIIGLLVYLPWLLREEPPRSPWAVSSSPREETARSSSSLVPQAIRARMEMYGETPLEIVSLPLRLFFQGKDDSGRTFDGVLGPLLILGLLPIALVTLRDGLVTSTILLYLVGALLFGPARVRYLAPILPLLVTKTLYNLKFIIGRFEGSHGTLLAIVVAQLVYNSAYIFKLSERVHLVDYLQGRIGREEILFRSIPEYDMIRFINEHLSDHTLTYLLLTGNRFYYYHRPVITAGHMSADPILSAIRLAKTPEDILLFLRSRGITHLMAHIPRTSDALSELTPSQGTIWNQFAQHLMTPLMESEGFGLWELHSP